MKSLIKVLLFQKLYKTFECTTSLKSATECSSKCAGAPTADQAFLGKLPAKPILPTQNPLQIRLARRTGGGESEICPTLVHSQILPGCHMTSSNFRKLICLIADFDGTFQMTSRNLTEYNDKYNTADG